MEKHPKIYAALVRTQSLCYFNLYFPSPQLTMTVTLTPPQVQPKGRDPLPLGVHHLPLAGQAAQGISCSSSVLQKPYSRQVWLSDPMIPSSLQLSSK